MFYYIIPKNNMSVVYPRKFTSKYMKNCGSSKVYNPATGHCIDVRSPLGRRISKLMPFDKFEKIQSMPLYVPKSKPSSAMVVNPLTGRRVRADGPTGQMLKELKLAKKPCGPGKVKNPVTLRCTKETSATAKMMEALRKKARKQKKPTEKKPTEKKTTEKKPTDKKPTEKKKTSRMPERPKKTSRMPERQKTKKSEKSKTRTPSAGKVRNPVTGRLVKRSSPLGKMVVKLKKSCAR